MDKSQKEHQEVPPHLEQKKLVEFLESLHRICKIGIYYPAGHKVLNQAAEQFQQNILGVADTNRSVLIELKSEALFVEDHEITTLTNALREFRKLILDLGIGGIEIDRAILLPELLQLVRSLLLGRSQLQGIKEFTQADIANLPTSVRVVKKEFLVDEDTILHEGTDEDAEHGLNTVFQALVQQGLERSQIEQCKKFLKSLSERFASRPLNVKGLPTVTWSDVRGLLSRAVVNAYHLSDTSGGFFVQNDLNALSTIFRGLGSEIQDKESQETIRILTSIFSSSSTEKPLAGGDEKTNNIRPADNIPVKSVEQLQSFITDNVVPISILEKITQVDRREELSILMQLLQFKQKEAAEGKIRQNLRDILNTPLNKPEFDTITMGVIHLVTCKDSSRFFDAMYFLAIIMRGVKTFSSQQFLLMVYQKIARSAQTLLWPILVNEILALGWSVNREVFGKLATIAAGLPGPEMKTRLPELETMDCFQEKKIAEDIFDPELEKAFPLFPYLLETSMKKQIGERVLNSLIAKPPDWLIEAVAPLLQLEIPQHMKFLQIYLLATQQDYFPINLRVAAGNLVVQHLPEISEQQKREEWVVNTIQAIPEMQVEESRQLLIRITEEKHMVIIPKWPNACRRAAAEALKTLRRRPL
ncbi:MAG: hypothetical protein KJ630_22175 [Proteobacteria bacterium]|nr:hypothetical protein [Pseudomonadota bacterium]